MPRTIISQTALVVRVHETLGSDFNVTVPQIVEVVNTQYPDDSYGVYVTKDGTRFFFEDSIDHIVRECKDALTLTPQSLLNKLSEIEDKACDATGVEDCQQVHNTATAMLEQIRTYFKNTGAEVY